MNEGEALEKGPDPIPNFGNPEPHTDSSVWEAGGLGTGSSAQYWEVDTSTTIKPLYGHLEGAEVAEKHPCGMEMLLRLRAGRGLQMAAGPRMPRAGPREADWLAFGPGWCFP
jgi:hypothetical protein